MIPRPLKELLNLTIEFMGGKLLSQPSLQFGICHELAWMCNSEIITYEEINLIKDHIENNQPNYWGENPDVDPWDQTFGFFFPCMSEGPEFITLRINFLKTLVEKL